MKLMIADDEKWVRATLKSIIPFDKLGLTLVCEASNGVEALELCTMHKPDILLTDIMMPGMTGLDLIKELRNCMPDLKIAIISGYSDFEYARTAMKYNITRYLLKPVEEAEISNTLEDFIREIAQERDAAGLDRQQKSDFKKALPMMCEAFLNRALTQNGLTAETIRSTLSGYNIRFDYQDFSVSVFTPDCTDVLDIRDKTDYCLRAASRIMKKYFHAVTFTRHGRWLEIITILNYQGNLDTVKFEKTFRLLNRLLQRNFGTTLSAGISASTRQLAMLGSLYNQAFNSLQNRFWNGPGKVHPYMAVQAEGGFPMKLTEEMLNKMSLNLKLSNSQPAIAFIDSAVEAMKLKGDIRPTDAREFLWQYAQSILGILNMQMQFITQYSMLYGEHPYERLKRTAFVDELCECAKEIITRIYELYHDINQVDNANVIEKAKKLIESNYAGDISLEQVSKHVHLSPAYLSELFKKETGMSFIDYKTLVRLDNAKRLLESSSYGVYDISSKVGYTDPKYFSKLFKKLTGKTVFEYRKEFKDRRGDH
jgi:two-component system response regulator YesN